MLSSNHGFIYYVSAIIAGAGISRYIRSGDNPDIFNTRIKAALPEADYLVIEEIPLADFQNLRGVNKGYDRAVLSDNNPLI